MKAAKDGLNIKLFYSTPTCYLKAVKDANPSLPTKQDDFFPYASDPTAYWTGYFTSRPTVKYFERLGNNYLQVYGRSALADGALTDAPASLYRIARQFTGSVLGSRVLDCTTGDERTEAMDDLERDRGRG
ncbi:Lysosomal alpha-mannosidase [Eumeta japonica]|uniref:Lysosomal alpha-mannosidase n=1 Tax=Eumeta variegata TaxID=151549 RepID=A0A4C1ZL22_EUMVA|nr:Lysosomal alpha-mannosidase [Eumeta japonica]